MRESTWIIITFILLVLAVMCVPNDRAIYTRSQIHSTMDDEE
jgi:hypothetical protein